MKMTIKLPKRSPAEQDYDELVSFFTDSRRSRQLGQQGDYDGLTSARAAIRAMCMLLDIAPRIRNKALKAELRRIGAL